MTQEDKALERMQAGAPWDSIRKDFSQTVVYRALRRYWSKAEERYEKNRNAIIETEAKLVDNRENLSKTEERVGLDEQKITKIKQEIDKQEKEKNKETTLSAIIRNTEGGTEANTFCEKASEKLS